MTTRLKEPEQLLNHLIHRRMGLNRAVQERFYYSLVQSEVNIVDQLQQTRSTYLMEPDFERLMKETPTLSPTTVGNGFYFPTCKHAYFEQAIDATTNDATLSIRLMNRSGQFVTFCKACLALDSFQRFFSEYQMRVIAEWVIQLPSYLVASPQNKLRIDDQMFVATRDEPMRYCYNSTGAYTVPFTKPIIVEKKAKKKLEKQKPLSQQDSLSQQDPLAQQDDLAQQKQLAQQDDLAQQKQLAPQDPLAQQDPLDDLAQQKQVDQEDNLVQQKQLASLDEEEDSDEEISDGEVDIIFERPPIFFQTVPVPDRTLKSLLRYRSINASTLVEIASDWRISPDNAWDNLARCLFPRLLYCIHSYQFQLKEHAKQAESIKRQAIVRYLQNELDAVKFDTDELRDVETIYDERKEFVVTNNIVVYFIIKQLLHRYVHLPMYCLVKNQPKPVLIAVGSAYAQMLINRPNSDLHHALFMKFKTEPEQSVDGDYDKHLLNTFPDFEKDPDIRAMYHGDLSWRQNIRVAGNVAMPVRVQKQLPLQPPHSKDSILNRFNQSERSEEDSISPPSTKRRKTQKDEE